MQPLLQAAVYILLCVGPVWLFSWLFIFVANNFVGSVLAVMCSALLGNFFCLRAFDGVGLERLGLPFNRRGMAKFVAWRGARFRGGGVRDRSPATGRARA